MKSKSCQQLYICCFFPVCLAGLQTILLIILDMTAPISQVRRKVFNPTSDPKMLTKQPNNDNLLQKSRKTETEEPKSGPSDIMANKSFLLQSIIKKKSSNPNRYSSSSNLKLGDYLRFTSLTRRAHESRVDGSSKSEEPKLMKNVTFQKIPSQHTIDMRTSIKVMKKQAKKQFMVVQEKLKEFISDLEKCEEITTDDESLIFMCKVLHIFEQKINKASRYAQDLIQQAKKNKGIEDDNTERGKKSPFSTMRSVRVHRANKSEVYTGISPNKF